MNAIPFTKVEAIGNHFVLVDALDMPEMNWPSLAVAMCAHHFGIGADGLLVLLPSEDADFRMRMFNADGSEDSCGNGLRCMAVYIRQKELLIRPHFTIEAKDGIRYVRVINLPDGSLGAKVNMGRPSLRPEDIPAVPDPPGISDMSHYRLNVGGEQYDISAVMIGSPHAVIEAPRESFWDTIPSVSPEIESHPLFPERVNVTWYAVRSSDSLMIRTWERGVGPTLGCGTGACAALVAAHMRGRTGSSAHVTSPGGTLFIEWPDREDVLMSGPARMVYEGVFHL